MIVRCGINDCPVRWLRLPFRLGYIRLRLKRGGCQVALWISASEWEWFRDVEKEAGGLR